jgi:hypothetical protein
MPSANTIASPSVLLPTQSLGNATTETQFQGAIPAKGLSGGKLTLPLTRSGQLSNRHIRFKVVGRVLPGTAGTFEVRMYISSIAAANLIIDTGPISLATNTSFLILCDCVWDQSSNSFNGVLYGQMGDTALGIAGLNNSVVSVTIGSSTNSDITSSETVLITGQFGSSDPSNGAFVDQFELEAM